MARMKVLVAPDSFGGTLSAVQAADAIARGWRRGAPDDHLVVRPLSDGGPGFVDVLASVLGGRRVLVAVPDPLGREVAAQFLLAGDVAYIESAQACGLHLLAAGERDPLATSSSGVGVLIAAALRCGARRVVVGLGGSATNDAGAGMLAALGVTPLDAAGQPLPGGGGALARLDRLAGAPQVGDAELVLASDVDNPLTGEHGASATFGPQKGATAEDVAVLDAALARWARIAVRDLPTVPPDLVSRPGAGAAGGLGAALLALGGRRESGIGLVRALVGLDMALDGAGLAVTGEGSVDWQSLRGKVITGVAAAATERGVPCVVLAGQVSLGQREMAAAGIDGAYSMAECAGSVEASLAEPDRWLAQVAERVAGQWSGGPVPRST